MQMNSKPNFVGRITSTFERSPYRHPKPVQQNVKGEKINSGKTLKECVFTAMMSYYQKVDDSAPTDVYSMLMTQVEPPLLRATMEYTRHNQSKAAVLLGLSRGTLRKKLKQYGLD